MSHNDSKTPATVAMTLAALITAHATQAAEDAGKSPDSADSLTTVTVTAAKLRPLEQFTPTGSRLGLDARNTPATIDVIDSDQMLGRGFNSVEESADSLPGVTSGGSPGDPAQLSMRGFTGNQITILHNGLYIGPANMTNRPQNVFNLESVEILKGPASVLYGQGAIGGVINVVNRAPSFGEPQANVLASVGRFGSTSFGFGGTTHFGDSVAVRADVSRTSTDGYINDSPSDSFNATTSVLWHVTPVFDAQFTLDYLKDNPSAYFGTPLVPVQFATDPLKGVIDSSVGLTIDKRMRYVNYNVSDSEIHSSQYWPQLLLKWMPTENLTLQNFVYYFHADRRWQNAETYQFDTTTNQITRDRFYVFHDQNLLGDQGSLSYKSTLFNRPNTFVAGFDYSHLSFSRVRGFPDGDSVDPFNPAPGTFGPLLQPGELVPRTSPTSWDDYAVFFEDAMDLTGSLKLVAGGRYDRLELDRRNYDTSGNLITGTSFQETYNSSTWRLGLVYKLTDNLSPYVSWTTGKDPPGTNNIFIVNAPEGRNALSESEQVEVGIKGNTSDDRADLTLAAYHILRKKMLVQTGIETLTNGGQRSQGLEASSNFKITPRWTVSANAAYTDSEYRDFDVNTGNQPADIPKWTANLWTGLREIGGLPLEIGGGVRYIGNRYANTENSVQLKHYTLLDAYASYGLAPNIMMLGRVRNLTNEAYAQWADIFYPSEVMLGEPRSYQLSVIAKF
jgi:iron complex outermembrane receptor protein